MAATASQAVAEVQAPAAGHEAWNPLQISAPMLGLTWLAFLLTAAILYKVAWKPILTVLDRREARLRLALEDADKARRAAEQAEAETRRLIAAAAEQARALVDEARRTAQAAAATIEQQARAQAQVLIADAGREIGAARDRAVVDLRRESGRLAIDLAGKLVRRNLDDEANRKLADDLIREL